MIGRPLKEEELIEYLKLYLSEYNTRLTYTDICKKFPKIGALSTKLEIRTWIEKKIIQLEKQRDADVVSKKKKQRKSKRQKNFSKKKKTINNSC